MKMFCVALVVHTNSIDSRIPNWNIYYHKIAYAVQDLRFLVTVWIHEHWQWTALHVTCLKLLERTNIPLGQSARKHCIIHFLVLLQYKSLRMKKDKTHIFENMTEVFVWAASQQKICAPPMTVNISCRLFNMWTVSDSLYFFCWYFLDEVHK